MKVLLSSLIVILLEGCHRWISDSNDVELRLIAKEDLNPDDNGRPSPLVVRVMKLKSAQSFRNADFFALYQAEKETLGLDLAGSEEVLLKPGEVKTLTLLKSPESPLLAIMGAYRHIDKVNWRVVLPSSFHGKIPVTLLLDAKGIHVVNTSHPLE